jgi:RHS repeat-associated protein
VLQETGSTEEHRHRFISKPMHSTGLYYYGARFYDPELGRFISMDPARDGLNWYVYVHNNPVKYVDPDGTTTSITRMYKPGHLLLPVIAGSIAFDLAIDHLITKCVENEQEEVAPYPLSISNTKSNRRDNKERVAHYTSLKNALSIMMAGRSYPSEDRVFAMVEPSAAAEARLAGAVHPEVKATFNRDPGWEKDTRTWYDGGNCVEGSLMRSRAGYMDIVHLEPRIEPVEPVTTVTSLFKHFWQWLRNLVTDLD